MMPDHETWIQILRNMTPEERLTLGLKMAEEEKEQLRAELRARFPHLSEKQLHTLFLKRRIQAWEAKQELQIAMRMWTDARQR